MSDAQEPASDSTPHSPDASAAGRFMPGGASYEMQFLADNSSEFISLADNDGRIRYLNKNGREMIGMAPDASESGICDDFLAPGERDRLHVEIFPQAAASGNWEGRLTLRHQNTGELIPVQLKWLKIMDKDNATSLGWAILARDLRPELASQDAIIEREERLRSAIELARLGTWNIDLRQGMVSYSQRVQELYGLPEGPVLLENMRGVHPDDVDVVAADLQKALHPSSGGVYTSEHRSLDEKTGDVHYLHSEGRVLYSSSGEPHMIIGTVQDVTETVLVQQALENQVVAHTEELQAANQQLQDVNSYLQQSNAELEQYAYVASHDLQEPLRKISVFAGMLAKMGDLPKGAKMMAEKISVASIRMTQLIRDLLDFSRLLKGENIMRPVDLNKVVRAVLTDFELQITEKQALVYVDNLPVIEAVPLQMNQLFYNLIGNSLKFAREGAVPEISIRCRRLDEGQHAVHGFRDRDVVYHYITVTDNGIGFNSLYAEQIFEVFKRLHTRHAYPGSGIGLALCRRILQNHGGIMTAQSQEGVGTTISMILPSTQVPDN